MNKTVRVQPKLTELQEATLVELAQLGYLGNSRNEVAGRMIELAIAELVGSGRLDQLRRESDRQHAAANKRRQSGPEH